MSFFAELKRRNVFRVATAYVVVGWLFTEIAMTLLPTFGAPEWVAKAIIFFFALAFLPIMVFVWAFELTPEGIKLEKDVDRSESITSETGKKLNYVTIGAVAIGIAFLAFTRLSGQAPVAAPEEVILTEGAPSVAVLPFVNMSGNAENEYFSDGLTETLLHMLAQIPELKVAARTSSFAFKGEESDVREIAAALDVAHVLEGSVQRSGDRVRITAQLIRADDGFHVWSANFDRTLDDIFAIQDEIAGKVGTALSASLLGSNQPANVVGIGTENLAAYDLYLHALSERIKGSYGALGNAEGMLKDALALDAGFYEAKTELAYVYVDQWQTGLAEGQSALRDVIALAEQVLADRPDDVRTTAILYYAEFMQSMFSGDPQAAFATLPLLEEHANRHPGDIETGKMLAVLLSRFNRGEEAADRLNTLIGFDPLNPALHYDLAVVYRELEQWQEVREAAERSLELEPAQPNALTAVGWSYRNQGDGVGFVRYYLQGMDVDPQDHELPAHIAEFLYDFNLPEEAAEFHRRVLSIAPSSPPAYLLELLRARETGDVAAARAAARKALGDDIENRNSAYEEAAEFLIEDAIVNGTTGEVMAYLSSVVPGLGDTAANVGMKYMTINFELINLKFAMEPWDEAMRHFSLMMDFTRSFGFEPDDDPFTKAILSLDKGDADGAIEIMVADFAETTPAQAPRLANAENAPWMAQIVDDPRMTAAIEDFKRRREQQRAEIRAFFAARSGT